MNGVAGEHGIGFHGVNRPTLDNAQKGMTILESIFSGRKAG